MKKFTLILTLIVFNAWCFGQNFGGIFPNCTEPTGYTFSQGARITPYTNPLVGNGCNDNGNDCGIITPGVGGNNPANVIFPPEVIPAGFSGFQKCFSIFVFDANLKCESDKAFPCDTYVTAYIVSSTYNSTTAPAVGEYFGVSNRQLVQAFGATNCISVFFDPSTPPVSGESYRVFLDFTNDGTCNQQNTKYVIDILPQGGPLPIRLSSFNGVKDVSKVLLNWKTTSEQNSKLFDVEFSKNGSTWTSIGQVKAAGTSTTQRTYVLSHATPVNGTNYYRLKQVDLNGNFSYSNVVAINFTIKGVNISAVYPNPFVSRIKIDISSDRSEVVRIQVSDNLGRVLKTQSSAVQKGVNNIWLDNLSNLAPGIYNIQVKTSYSTYRYKLQK